MSDAVLQELIVRLASDEGFAGTVRAQPSTLDAYDLSEEERATLLGLGADAGPGASGLAERQSKSSLLFMGAGHHVDAHVNLTGHAPATGEHGFAGPITHDIKLHDALGAQKADHVGMGDGSVHPGVKPPMPFEHDAKIHDAGLGAGKLHEGGLGADKSSFVGGLGADKHAAGGLDAAKMAPGGKIMDGGFTGGVKISEVNGDG